MSVSVLKKDCGHVIFYADNESKISGKIRVEKTCDRAGKNG